MLKVRQRATNLQGTTHHTSVVVGVLALATIHVVGSRVDDGETHLVVPAPNADGLLVPRRCYAHVSVALALNHGHDVVLVARVTVLEDHRAPVGCGFSGHDEGGAGIALRELKQTQNEKSQGEVSVFHFFELDLFCSFEYFFMRL